MEEDKIIKELGSGENDELWKVTRAFYLCVREGPLVPTMPGDVVRLTHATAKMNFAAQRILPVGFSDPGRYEVLEDFKTADEHGLWIEFHPGDILELSLPEGLDLMKKFYVKPLKGGEGNETEIFKKSNV